MYRQQALAHCHEQECASEICMLLLYNGSPQPLQQQETNLAGCIVQRSTANGGLIECAHHQKEIQVSKQRKWNIKHTALQSSNSSQGMGITPSSRVEGVASCLQAHLILLALVILLA